MNITKRTLTVVVAATAIVSSGCSSSSKSDDGGDTSAGTLLQVDGKIVTTGETFEVDPNAEGENITFGYGPEVQRASVQAIAASGVVARVYYRPTAEAPIATSVEQAPEFGEDVLNYTGTIALINDERIVIDGKDGERSFDISKAEEDAFDAPHLEDHQSEGTSVKVYYREADGKLTGVAYEDA